MGILEQFNQVNQLFDDLRFCEDKRVISGPISFDIEGYIGSFDVEIIIPSDYPNSLPSVCEISNKIPRFNKCHVNHNGTLCLGSRRRTKEIFFKEPTLLGFVRNIMLPFFYSFCYRIENGVWPYGELSHGSKGLLEDYKEFLGLTSKQGVINFLDYIIFLYQNPQRRFRIRSRGLCPCGSKLRFNKCHKKFDTLFSYYSLRELEVDRNDINNHYTN